MAVEEGIFTEVQLAAAIEAERWYDSDSDTEGAESLLGAGGAYNRERLIEEVDWTSHYWNTGDQLGDLRPLTITVETILKQLNLETESVDFGDESDISGNQVTEEVKTQAAGTHQNSSNDQQPASEDAKVSQVLQASSGATPIAATSTTGQLERSKYYCIAHEIMTTERTYVQSLRLLEKVVHGAVKTAQMTRHHILPEQGRKEIFLNIGEIYALNFDLLKELEERIENWDSCPMIADVIAKRAPFFKLYSMYSARFDSAQVAYCKWLKASKRFANLIRVIETGPLCKGLPVSSYMLCPVQRIPRYKLLLEDYLRHLPEGHPDIENTRAALAAISEAADHMNDRISDMENQAKVVHMQKLFSGKENLVAPGRKYLGRGPVYFVPGSKRKQRVLFLFSDVLLVAGITAAGRYRIHHKMSLSKMLVSVVQSPILSNAFCIAERGLPKPLRFCTKSLEERNKWITELRKAKAKDEDVFVTLSKNSPYASVLNDPEAHSSILAVLNDPSFEHNHPSWVRRSLHLVPTSVRKGLPFASYALAAGASGEGGGGDAGVGGGESVRSEGVEEVDFMEEVMTEFVSEEERNGDKVLKPGMDNSLSSYMNQLSGNVWRRRWFVLTCRTLVCYEDHKHDVATGGLSLEGYSVTSLEPEEVNGREYTLKLRHRGKLTHILQLPTSYDYERWLGVLKEQLQPASRTHV